MTNALAIDNRLQFFNGAYLPASDFASEVQQRWLSVVKNPLQDTASDWGPLITAALGEIGRDCGTLGWDGEEGESISDQTIGLTRKIADMLFISTPKSTPAPDVIPESDGEICLSWILDADKMFALSINQDGKMNYAGQFGHKGARHGWKPIDTDDDESLERSVSEIAQELAYLFT